MRKQNWKTYLFGILLAEGVGALAGLLSMSGIREYNTMTVQPPFSPPAWLFPAVWGILYALMGIGVAGIYLAETSKERGRALDLFTIQLIVNFFWSILFFNLQAYGLAFGWLLLLWVLIVLMIFAFYAVVPWTAWLQIPYLIWVTFAAYLNLGVWLLNG